MSRAFICLDLRPLHAVTHLVSWRSKTKMMLTSDYLIDTLFLQREASTPTLQATTANEWLCRNSLFPPLSLLSVTGQRSQWPKELKNSLDNFHQSSEVNTMSGTECRLWCCFTLCVSTQTVQICNMFLSESELLSEYVPELSLCVSLSELTPADRVHAVDLQVIRNYNWSVFTQRFWVQTNKQRHAGAVSTSAAQI